MLNTVSQMWPHQRRHYWCAFVLFFGLGLIFQALIAWGYFAGPRDEYGLLWRTPPVEFLVGSTIGLWIMWLPCSFILAGSLGYLWDLNDARRTGDWP